MWPEPIEPGFDLTKRQRVRVRRRTRVLGWRSGRSLLAIAIAWPVFLLPNVFLTRAEWLARAPQWISPGIARLLIFALASLVALLIFYAVVGRVTVPLRRRAMIECGTAQEDEHAREKADYIDPVGCEAKSSSRDRVSGNAENALQIHHASFCLLHE